MFGPYTSADLNMPHLDYEEELRPLRHLSFTEYLRHVRLTRSTVTKRRPPEAARDEGLIESCTRDYEVCDAVVVGSLWSLEPPM